jgi:hypothetical protein
MNMSTNFVRLLIVKLQNMTTIVISGQFNVIRIYTNVNYAQTYYLFRSQGSSVSTVSDYRLDDRAIEVRSPAEARAFFL